MNINGLIVFFTLAAGNALAQECDGNMAPSTPTERFIIHGDGLVTEAYTGLSWTTCSLGQTYVDGRCNGDAQTFDTWQEALVAANAFNRAGMAGFNDFRMPSVKELASIVERDCYNPAINLEVFPDTANNVYTSSTPAVVSINNYPARYIQFENGSEFVDLNLVRVSVRLVRDSDYLPSTDGSFPRK